MLGDDTELERYEWIIVTMPAHGKLYTLPIYALGGSAIVIRVHCGFRLV